jgi:hypothetical protein
MRASISRVKKIEAAVREKFSKVIEEMENRRFLELMKTCPPWLPEVYTFYFLLINQANQYLAEAQVLPEGIRRPVHPEAYSFLLESMEELFHGRETVSREEIKQAFINVIRGSPLLGEESRNLLLEAGNATNVTDEDMQRIYQK